MSERPRHGVRVLFSKIDDRPSYRIELHTPAATFTSRDELSPESQLGDFDRASGEGELEPWMRDVAANFWRTLVKNSRLSGEWPNRLMRWRGAR